MSDSVGSSSAQIRLGAFAAAAAITVSEELDDNFDQDIDTNTDNLVTVLLYQRRISSLAPVKKTTHKSLSL
jgi:hypothetical protein